MPNNDEIIRKYAKEIGAILPANSPHIIIKNNLGSLSNYLAEREDTIKPLNDMLDEARADERKKHTKIIKGICPEGKHQEILEAGIRQGKRETAEEIFRELENLLKKYCDSDYIDKEDLDKLKAKYLKGEKP